MRCLSKNQASTKFSHGQYSVIGFDQNENLYLCEFAISQQAPSYIGSFPSGRYDFFVTSDETTVRKKPNCLLPFTDFSSENACVTN